MMEHRESNFKASQMPIKQRIQQIDVSTTSLVSIGLEQHQRRNQVPEREQEGLPAAAVGVRHPRASED